MLTGKKIILFVLILVVPVTAVVYYTGFFITASTLFGDIEAVINESLSGRPRVLYTRPANGEKRVQLYQPVEVIVDRKTARADIEVINCDNKKTVPGKTTVEGFRVLFLPDRIFLPGTTYKVIFRAESTEQIKIQDRFSFTTVDTGQNYWVEVKLGERHTLTVYRGKEIIRSMAASGGMPQSPTPTGVFYTGDRGYSFWSHRYGEGATYWVRLAGQILIHSVPRDSNWQTKEEEHAKLGLPASHGCIRLDEEDARWFFENIPRGTMVIIHK